MITITKQYIYLLVGFLVVLFNCSVLGFIPSLILSQCISSILCVSIPGISILFLLSMEHTPFGERLLYGIGLGVAFLYGIGLLANWFFPLFHLLPLRTIPLLETYDMGIGILLLISFFKVKKMVFRIAFSSLSLTSVCLGCVPIFFLFLSIFGAFSLNNQGSNVLTMCLLAGIALYIPLLVFFSKQVSPKLFPWAIFFISISLLFMLSLRSWHITGWDINDEFRVFQKTKDAGYWAISAVDSAYNACLSITLLPTVFSQLTKIPDEYLFKVLFQIVFAFVPVTMYFLIKRYANAFISLLAVFYFIIQPFFIQPTISLVRQETAFIFFVLLLLVTFSKDLSKGVRTILFTIFGFSMVLSHYSTSYISLFLLGAGYGLTLISEQLVILPFFSRFTAKVHRASEKSVPSKHKIDPILLLVLFLFTSFWYSQVNSSSDNLGYIIQNTLINMTKIFSEAKSSQQNQSLSIFSHSDPDPMKVLRSYQKAEELVYQNMALARYQPYAYSSYAIKPVSARSVQPLITSSVNTGIIHVFDIVKLVTKLAVIVGAVYLVVTMYKENTDFIDREYLGLSFVGTSLIILMLVHPTITQFYNPSRIFLQILVIVSVISVIGILFILHFIVKKRTEIFAAILLSLTFLYLSGFMSGIIGGIAYLHLNNYGDDYDKFYTRLQEKYAITWLDTHYQKQVPLYADVTANLRVIAYTKDLFAITTVLPSVLPINSYVYVDYTNIASKRADANDSTGNAITYTYPLKFLQDTKNLLYSNGESEVFK